MATTQENIFDMPTFLFILFSILFTVMGFLFAQAPIQLSIILTGISLFIFIAKKPVYGIMLLILSPILINNMETVLPKLSYLPIGYILIGFLCCICCLKIFYNPSRLTKLNTMLDVIVLMYLFHGLFYLILPLTPKLIAVKGFNQDYKPILIYLFVRILNLKEITVKKIWSLLTILPILLAVDGLYCYFFNYEKIRIYYLTKLSLNWNPTIISYLNQHRLGSIWLPITNIGLPMLVALINVLCWLLIYKKYKVINLLALLIVPLLIISIILNKSRSVWCGTLISILVFTLHATKKNKEIFRWLTVIVTVSTIFMVWISRTKQGQEVGYILKQRVSTLINPHKSTELDEGGHYRTDLNALKEIIKKPMGNGLGSCIYDYKEYIPNFIWAESGYLQVGLERGILGMILFILLFYQAFVVTKKAYTHITDPLWQLISLSTISIIPGLAISMTSFPYWNDLVFIYLFATLGFINNKYQNV